jgi:hypothetical protein
MSPESSDQHLHRVPHSGRRTLDPELSPPMDTNQLKQTLDTLHDELSHGQQFDEEARQRLRILLADIHAVLDRDPEKQSPHEKEDALSDRLQEAVSEFEAAHPQFSQLIGRIADGLSNLGI